MTKKEKQLLLQVLCEMLPYGVKVQVCNLKDYAPTVKGLLNDELFLQFDYITEPIKNGDSTYNIINDNAKPYLRPMSSMTEEEKKELLNIVRGKGSKYFHISEEGIDNNDAEVQRGPNFEFHWVNFSYKNIEKATDWLNKKMFDWRGLIPKDLALESPKDMYK